MTVLARIEDGIIVEIIQPLLNADGEEWPVEARFTEEFLISCADITGAVPQPAEWWSAERDGAGWRFTAPHQAV